MQKERLKLIKKVCHKYADNFTIRFNRDSFKHILVDDTRKVLYCEIPKTACTNWKRLLAFMTGKPNVTSPMHIMARSVHNKKRMARYGLVYMNSYKPKEILYRLENYYKFLMVRNPLERILSAYNDKFKQTNRWTEYFQRKYGSMIVDRYRKHPNISSLALGNDVSFDEFVKYLIDPVTISENKLNAHWEHFHKMCHPCHINYNAVGKFETFEEDSQNILKDLGSERLAFPKNLSGNRTKASFHKNYDFMSPEDFNKLLKTYQLDFEIFGYDSPPLRKI